MISTADALWAAKLHVKTTTGGTPGTLLSTEMVLAICIALIEREKPVTTLFTDGIKVTP